MSMEISINERVNSAMYSDVISSYVDINEVTARRNIVPGSYKEAVTQCTDQTLATLNSAGGQTLYTRLKLTPEIRNATLAQMAQIYFQYVIPKNSLGVILKQYSDTAQESISENIGATGAAAPTEHLQFKIFYDTGFSIASMVQLCISADAKVSTENFNYQQTLLTLNSIPDISTEGSTTETTLKGLVEDPLYAGVGSGLIDVKLDASSYCTVINKDIGIEGMLDLNKSNPLFHNFPIITRNMGEMYLRLYMENFLRSLNIVYLNKHAFAGTTASGTISGTVKTGDTINLTAAGGGDSKYTVVAPAAGTATGTNVLNLQGVTVTTTGSIYHDLPYARLPIDKADLIYLDGIMYKVRLINVSQYGGNTIPASAVAFNSFTIPIWSLPNISWKRFEIRRFEFDIEDYEDIKASQGKAGVYKCPIHMWRSKNFDQTNAASSSANALQTTLNAPNIDRMFITQPFSRDYPGFLPTLMTTDINPQIANTPVLPRTEDSLNSRTCERIYSVYTDTDKYSPSRDLMDSTNVPVMNKQLWIKSSGTYGGAGSFEKIQRGIDNPLQGANVLLPNKFGYALGLNMDGCYRRGYNSVLNGMYSPTLPLNLQQSVQTSADIYYSPGTAGSPGTGEYDTNNQGDKISNSWKDFTAAVSYGPFTESGAVASVHCLCDYILSFHFDPYGNMTNITMSEHNGN